MPTYASTANFDLSIDDIAEEAFERCGLQNRSGYDIKTARRSINLMLAEWANIKLIERLAVFMSYPLRV